MYLVKTPQFIQNLFPNFTWKIPTAEKVLYLTFDDGPIPDITPWVLSRLEEYNAKATFFVVGENINKHPDVYEKVVESGHSIGNHTFTHVNGWTSENVPYFLNIRRCAHLIGSELFRPPYGKLKPRQSQFLQRHYRIVMWDVLSGDFDQRISREQCLQNVIGNAGKGSVVVFHDSLKAWGKLEYVLPRVLQHFSEKGYRFESLEQLTTATKVASVA